MLQSVKDFLATYKVRVALVGGVVVVATAFGTCSFDPTTTSDEETQVESDAVPAAATEAAEEAEAAAATEATEAAEVEEATEAEEAAE